MASLLEDGRTVCMPMVCVILPAAGVGERTGLSHPKQFCKIMGRPLISFTIEAFEKIPWIHNIFVVVSTEYRIRLEEILKQFSHQKVLLVEGSSTRHRSIYNGVLAVERICSDARIIVIHDAVRPFVDEHTVRSVTEAAFTNGAAGVVRPLVSTVVATDLEGFLDHSLDRSKYRLSEMPQAFTLDVIKKAYEQSTDYDLDYGTECLHLVQRYVGAKVRLIDGPENLWKVTYKRDFYAMEGMVKGSRNNVCMVFRGEPDPLISNSLENSLVKKMCDGVNVVSLGFEEFCQARTKEISLHNIVLFHGDNWEANSISSSTEKVDLVLQEQKADISPVCLIIHLIVFKCSYHEYLKAIMSEARNRRGNNRIVNAVVSNVEEMSEAFDIISSLILERNSSFNGQTFVV